MERLGVLIEERIDLRGETLSLLRPPDPEALLDEDAFEREEFLPYWAELWPSGLALARQVARRDLTGCRVLELGCGLGLPALAAARAGADVVATDWAPDAIALLRENARRNGVVLETARVDWKEPQRLLSRSWDLVLAADVLYERRDVEPLLRLLGLLDATEALVAEPGRPASRDFLARARARWNVTSERGAASSVRIYRLLLTPGGARAAR